ncbi:MAG TPA: class I SAM-dependent methyltransferase [Solirubrobacterales bacterium]
MAISGELGGIERLLDVGNGGVFQYDTELVGEIVAVDLFLSRLPASAFPDNVTAQDGDALDLEQPDAGFDGVVHSLLYHHLVGEDPEAMVENVRRAIAEAERVLKPGGRLIVAESCVPRWFYPLEKAMFRPLVALSRTRLLGGHPAVIQLPSETLTALLAERFEIESAREIPLGRWTTQFGRRWPSALTPAKAVIVVGRKPAAG